VRRGQQGQSTVELALCLPVLAFLAAVIVQIGIVVSMQTRLWHAAREAARVAVVDPDEGSAAAAARSAGVHGIEMTIEPRESERRMGEPLTVSLVAQPTGGVPLVSSLFGRMTLRARATMRIEQP
jgi:Flp pilus assembly protein TadG